MPKTLFDKIWDAHVVAELESGWSLLHIDRQLLHDLSGGRALEELAKRGHSIGNPALTFATPDHSVSSQPDRARDADGGGRLASALRRRAGESGLRFFDMGKDGHGIVHVMGPELGIVLPGLTVVCGDSHTCTNGGLGALAFGVGMSELMHVLVTQTLLQKKPKRMRLSFDGARQPGVTAKDMMLHAIGALGADYGTGFALEFSGDAVRTLSVEERLTLCNMAVEMGSKIGMVAPDDTTFSYIAGRRFAPKDALFDTAVKDWRALATDSDALFEAEHRIDMADVAPQITWGVSPEQVLPITGRIPEPAGSPARREATETALDYMGLTPGQAIAGTKIDWVFIGSCTNARLSDLRAAASVLRGRKVAHGVTAWVVPGSERVKCDAEAEGLDTIFRNAGFEWREPGCALCVAANGEAVPPQARCVSTSNRNFIGRQGPQARTHLASPAMAAAAALAGAIVDVRSF